MKCFLFTGNGKFLRRLLTVPCITGTKNTGTHYAMYQYSSTCTVLNRFIRYMAVSRLVSIIEYQVPVPVGVGYDDLLLFYRVSRVCPPHPTSWLIRARHKTASPHLRTDHSSLSAPAQYDIQHRHLLYVTLCSGTVHVWYCRRYVEHLVHTGTVLYIRMVTYT